MHISTIIPAFNRASLIGETLRTVLSQSVPPHEVIVVDDGSSDGTPDAVAAFGKDVTLIRQANAGAGAARNAGLARSSGEVIHFMDSDDLCSLNQYEAAARRFAQGADMTYGPWLKTRFDGMRLVDPEPVVIQQGPVPSELPMDVLVLRDDWVTVFQPCLFRRELIERAGPYRTYLKPSEDTELLYRIAAAAHAPAHVAEALVLYRVHPENQVSEQNIAARLIDRANLWAALEQHARGRVDLDAEFWRAFRRRKYLSAVELKVYEAAKAEALAHDVGALDRGLFPLRHFARRVRRKVQSMAKGHLYGRAFSAAPLHEHQRALIEELGYAIGPRVSETIAG